MIDVHKTDDREGFCMECEPDANGRMPMRQLYGFKLGSFHARLCRPHIIELANSVRQAVAYG